MLTDLRKTRTLELQCGETGLVEQQIFQTCFTVNIPFLEASADGG